MDNADMDAADPDLAANVQNQDPANRDAPMMFRITGHWQMTNLGLRPFRHTRCNRLAATLPDTTYINRHEWFTC